MKGNQKLLQLVESQMARVAESRNLLRRRWSPYLNAVKAHMKEHRNRDLTDYESQQIAQCLENAVFESAATSRSRVFETTYSDNITFLGVQLPVIAALLPSLVLNEIGIVQALDRRTGSIFYMDLQYGQTKGSLASGATFIGAKTGHATSQASRRYAMEYVYGESVGSAGSTSYPGTLAYHPIVAGSLTISDGVETFTDAGDNTLTSSISGGSAGTIDYATGVFAVTFQSPTATAPTADYKYNYEKATNGVPEVNVSLSSESITAEDFVLRAKYSLGAAIDLEKAFETWAVRGAIRGNNNSLNSVNLCN